MESNNQLPLVSVAIVTYNQKEFLRECIESVLAQDYKNIEIVVADDCSTDGTQEMILEYYRNYPNKFIIKLSEKNQGITQNSNLALNACSGKYVAFMGGDDLMLPGKIEKQVRLMELNSSCDVCFHDMDVFESDTNKTLYFYGARYKSKSGDIATIIRRGSINCASATMFRTEKIPQFGFREDLPVVSDWMFTIDVLSKGGRIYYMREALGRYRRHMSNVSSKHSSMRVQNTRDLIRSCSLCLENYPEHSKEAILRLSAVLREARHINSGKFYLSRILASILSSGGIKSIIGLMVYYITRGRVAV